MAKRKFVFYLSISFIIGTLAAGNGWNFLTTLALSVVAVCFILAVRGRTDSFLKAWVDLRKIVLFSALFLFAGFFYYYFFLNLRDQRTEIPLNQELVFVGVVSNDPENRDTFQLFEVSLVDPFSGKAKVFAPSFPRFRYGDLLEISGRAEESLFRNDWATIFYPELQLLETGKGFWLKRELLELKNLLVAKFPLYLDRDKSALLAGLTFGERGGFSEELKTDMARSGVTHIVALSGYNIAILALAIEKAFSYFLSRRKRFYLTLALIFIFVLMVGGEASVVRAAIMGALALLAEHIGRPRDILHLVALTAVGMVLIDPTVTVFDLGFQLSFLSLLGIILIQPALGKIFGFTPGRKESFLAWKENGLTTISAQLAVFPVLIVNFDYFSLTSILANILILFTVPLVMFLGFLLAALSAVSVFLGFFAAKIVSALLFYQIWVIHFFSAVSIPIRAAGSPILIYGIFYALIAMLIGYARKYEKTR